MKDTVFDIILIMLSMLVVGGVLIGVAKYLNEQDEKEWNNGYCECGGHFVYEQAVGHQYRTSYVYKCDSCGKHIEVWEER